MTATWKWVTLSEVLDLQPNKRQLQQGWSPRCIPTPSPSFEKWGVLKTTAIQPGRFDDSQNKELPETLSARPAIEVRAGDLLMTCAGPRSRCGVPALVRTTRPRLMMSGKMYRFRPKPGVRSDFLEKWLLSDAAQTHIDAMKTGISDSGLNLTQDRFLALKVPVPSASEQRRIVEIIEEHLSHLDAADASLTLASRRLDVLLRAELNRIVWNGGAPLRPIRDLLAEPMRNGRSDRATTDTAGTRTLTLTAVTRREFSDRYTKITSTPAEAADPLWLRPGDVLVQRSNTPELVGSSAMFEGPERWAIFPDLLIRLRAESGMIEPAYLALALRSESAHRTLRSKAKGLAGSMPKIDQAAIGSLEIPVPELGEQRLAAEMALEAEVHVGRLLRSATAQEKRSSALRRAVLAAAFSGRLTGASSDTDLIEELAGA